MDHQMKTANRDRLAHNGAGKSGPSALARLFSRIKRYLILPLIFLSLASSPSFSADFNKGLKAYNSGDYATALREWTPLAEQGEADAQYNLGQMYRNGRGVPQDDTAAMKWYRLAAEQGDAKAQFVLGAIYFLGQGVPRDDVYAHMWWNIAAATGNEDAVKSRDIITKMMSPADISKAQKLARECVAKDYKNC